jgi:ABC-2 type transport system ATP-binding protein
MIQINNLSFSYRKTNPLFKDLDLNIEAGKINGLLGKNGAGKTTLLKLMAGLQYPIKGDISIANESSKGRKTSYLEQYYYVAEEFNLPSICIDAYIKIYAPFYKNFDLDVFDNCMQEFKMPKRQKLNKMSYGQKKKFLLSFGIACNSKILFMDEPTNGLDIPSKSTFRQLIVEHISDDRAFIISTHQIKDIESMIDTVVILEDGKVMFNQDMFTISQKLCFENRNEDELTEDVLFSQNQIMNHKVIALNNNNKDTIVDVELLFNAVIEQNQELLQAFQN